MIISRPSLTMSVSTRRVNNEKDTSLIGGNIEMMSGECMVNSDIFQGVKNVKSGGFSPQLILKQPIQASEQNTNHGKCNHYQ